MVRKEDIWSTKEKVPFKRGAFKGIYLFFKNVYDLKSKASKAGST